MELFFLLQLNRFINEDLFNLKGISGFLLRSFPTKIPLGWEGEINIDCVPSICQEYLISKSILECGIIILQVRKLSLREVTFSKVYVLAFKSWTTWLQNPTASAESPLYLLSIGNTELWDIAILHFTIKKTKKIIFSKLNKIRTIIFFFVALMFSKEKELLKISIWYLNILKNKCLRICN